MKSLRYCPRIAQLRPLGTSEGYFWLLEYANMDKITIFDVCIEAQHYFHHKTHLKATKAMERHLYCPGIAQLRPPGTSEGYFLLLECENMGKHTIFDVCTEVHH